MGVSTDGILFYGYDLGNEEEGWKLLNVEENGYLHGVDWYDLAGEYPRNDFAEAANSRLFAVKSSSQVEVDSHCSSESPMYYLCAERIEAARGYPQEVDFVLLERRRIEEGWDAKLKEALDALGITPDPSRARWLLASDWS